MEPAERLEAWLSSPEPSLTPDDDEELLAPLAAAARLAALQHAEPAPTFALALEDKLLVRARYIQLARATAEASRTADAETFDYVRDEDRGWGSAPQLRRRVASRTPPLLWPLLAAAVLLALGAGTFSATAHAGPSSPLYGIHRTVENAQVQLASSQAQRAQLHLQYATEALTDLDNAAKNADQTGYATALATLQSETAATKQATAALPGGPDANTLANQLDNLRARAWQDLAANLLQLNWGNRVATTLALGGLGALVPHVSAVTITQTDGSDRGNGQQKGNATDQVVVAGGDFEAGATVMVNGQPAGQVSTLTVTPTQLTAAIAPAALAGAQSIGVSNPDGTAAQTSALTWLTGAGNNGNGNGNGDGNGNNKRPTPTPGNGKSHP